MRYHLFHLISKVHLASQKFSLYPIMKLSIPPTRRIFQNVQAHPPSAECLARGNSDACSINPPSQIGCRCQTVDSISYQRKASRPAPRSTTEPASHFSTGSRRRQSVGTGTLPGGQNGKLNLRLVSSWYAGDVEGDVVGPAQGSLLLC